MFLFDISNGITLVLMLAATVLLIFLSQEEKKSFISAIALVGFIAILVMHVAQVATLGEELRTAALPVLTRCIAIDFVFVLITFFSYLWVDDIEAKATGKKSIGNSLDWFWKKV